MLQQEVKTHLSRLIEPIFSLILGLILLFILAQAGTWVGITRTSITLPALMIVALVVIAWLVARTRMNSHWHSTPLDLALPLWMLAFAISTAANWSMHQYIIIGLWFAGLYLLIWYIVVDVLSNRLISLNRLMDSLFIASLPVLASAFHEFIKYDGEVRVSGFMRNPNILASFLVLIIPLAFSRILDTQGYKRGGYILLTGAASLVMLLSQSRGGALAICYSFGFIIFQRTQHPIKRAAIIAGALLIAFLLFGLRGDSGRVPIYEHALDEFSEKLLTGQGLFTYRTREFPRAYLLLLPPDGQNLHAHNLWIQIGVELGIVGILALGVMMIQFARIRPTTHTQQWCLAALFGLLVQQMIDFTLMTPSIAVCTIAILAIASATTHAPIYKMRFPVWLLAALALLLVAVGAVAGYVPRDLL